MVGYIKPEFLQEFIRRRYFCVFFPMLCDGVEAKQIVFSAHVTFPSGGTAGRWHDRRRGVVQRWELDYIGGSERVSRCVECQLRKQESPTDPKRPIIHFSHSFFILYRIIPTLEPQRVIIIF